MLLEEGAPSLVATDTHDLHHLANSNLAHVSVVLLAAGMCLSIWWT